MSESLLTVKRVQICRDVLDSFKMINIVKKQDDESNTGLEVRSNAGNNKIKPK